MCYNIHHGVGCDGRLDLERITRVIERRVPDLVGLNEVDIRFHQRSRFEDQLGWLADRLEMTGIFGAAIRWNPPLKKEVGCYGNGLLIRGTVDNEWNRCFPGWGSDESRAMLVVDVKTAEGPVRTVVTHMGLTPWMRRRQVRALLDLCREYSGPLIAMGDWNVLPNRPAVTCLSPYLIDVLAAFGVTEGTYPCASPQKRIDYVFCSPHFQIREAGVVDTEDCPSDHRPVWCHLDLDC